MQNEYLDISVIIPTYNRAEKLPNVLEAWKDASERTSCTYELVFSDDGSEDDTLSILRSCEGLPIKVIENNHGGASSARNNAIKHAVGNRIIFAGDDIYPDPHFIQKHFAYGQEYGDSVAILGEVDWHPDQCRNYLLKHITEIGNEQFSFNRLKPDCFTDFRHFYTCNVSVSSEMLNSIKKKFDESFYKYGYEDIELSYRLSKNGMKILYKPDIFGYHYHEYTAEKFCLRQSAAGEMAVVFTALHPEVDSILGVGKICDAYKKYKDTAKATIITVDAPSIEKVINVCNVIESELQDDIDDRYEFYIKRILSILYEKSFRYKYHEGMLKNKFPDDVNSICRFLTGRYLDNSLRDAVMAEYYISMKSNAGLVGLIFGSMISRKDTVATNIQLNMKEVQKKIFDTDFDDSILYAANRQLVINRIKVHLKKYYLLRQMKYKYDSIRRALFLRLK